ncbi:MFS transporter [Pseudoteredinibacter isoporae]|uniref:PPP family 3-phenylpropionic acid transporter n=1 Tax=Pseudoteredinibacter isoporae TaxID=570281 RepID=A0A7X0MYR5_9GAMM|nr:MFS transporter [Pseudoteredinibacter isoporae]MBB6523369.1 PPP family 3-phenylpropionic acid transporter [Pseudoteredinibacter isoporae]NHO88881.1 MFS transporter [Pseudoteredinibacter isoporae]NIB24411.1 MFS transporter [Pseudoteredinibacter isoporae]
MLDGQNSAGESAGASNRIPYWRLSIFYFFYFAVLGALVPFWSLYLQSIDYSAQEIGYVMAALAISRIVAPNIWGWLADKTGQRLRIIRWGSCLAVLCFLGVFWQKSFAAMFAVVIAYSFFWNAVLAQFEVVTLDHLNEEPEQYSRIRLWGSVGFIVAVVLLGALFDAFSIALLPLALLVLLLAIWVSSLTVSEAETSHHVAHGDQSAGESRFTDILKRREVWVFFVASFFLQISHGAHYTFFSVLLEEQGYSSMVIGGLWALGVLAEIILFMYMPALLRLFGARLLFWAALFSAAVRWLLTPLLVDFFIALFLLQWLHALTFGAAHAVSIEWVRRFFPSSSHGQGQALYTALSFGAGGALGAILCGYLWEISAFWCFAFCAIAAFLGFVLSFWGMRKAKLD